MSLLIYGASQIVQISNTGQQFKKGTEMGDICVLERSQEEGLSIAVDSDGKIIGIGTDSEIQEKFSAHKWTTKIDAKGKSIVPGLVDAHTHPVWAGDRVHEFSMKLAGASYLDIHKAGGGIHFTVDKTRSASKESLLKDLVNRLRKMSRAGTTLVECKSGYGLDWDNELKMLEVIEEARSLVDVGISSTYCGAHAVPKGKSPAETSKIIAESHIPLLKLMQQKGQLHVDSVDVFCEKGVFEVEDSKLILESAKENGFLLNFHAEELNYIGGVEMGASLQAEAMSHLEEISEEGIQAMASSGSVAVLLPTTAFLLRLQQPPARKLIEAGVPVALGSDFNPNAHCLSMSIVMFLACIQMKMSLNEALVAGTLNAAHSLRRGHEVGSLEEGKWADILIVDSPRWEHLIYQFGNHEDIISYVIYHGKVVKSLV